MIKSRRETEKTEGCDLHEGNSHSVRGQNGMMGKMKGACPEDESLSEILSATWEWNLRGFEFFWLCIEAGPEKLMRIIVASS